MSRAEKLQMLSSRMLTAVYSFSQEGQHHYGPSTHDYSPGHHFPWLHSLLNTVMGFLVFSVGFLEISPRKSTLRPCCPCTVVLEEAEPVERVGGAGDELMAEAPDVVVAHAHSLVLLLAGLLEGAHAVGAVVLKLEKLGFSPCLQIGIL